jgi:hypothetical protein
LPRRTDAPSAAELEATMRARAEAVATFRGQARLRYEGPDGKLKASQMIVVESPDKIRMDFMSPFGPTYTVAADGESLVAYDRGEKVLYRGRASARNVAEYIRVPVSVGILASLMRGLPPLIEQAGSTRVTALADGWRWVADLKTGGRLAVDFDASGTRPLSATVEGAGHASDMFARFDDYEDVDGAEIAHTISAKLPTGGQVELKYSRIWRSIGLTEGAFHIDAPSGVRVISMDEGSIVQRGEGDEGG